MVIQRVHVRRQIDRLMLLFNDTIVLRLKTGPIGALSELYVNNFFKNLSAAMFILKKVYMWGSSNPPIMFFQKRSNMACSVTL